MQHGSYTATWLFNHIRRSLLIFSWNILFLQQRYAYDLSLHTAPHCNTLQHAATRCNTLQRKTYSHHLWMTQCSAMQRAATHCNALQRTATHCNTLRHTATHSTTLQRRRGLVRVVLLRLLLLLLPLLLHIVAVHTCHILLASGTRIRWLRLVGSLKT